MELSQTDLEKYKELETAARTYCKHMEETTTGETPFQFLSVVQTNLLNLYSIGRTLPDIDAPESDFEDLLTEEEFLSVLHNIGKRAPFDMYNVFLETFDIDKPVHGLGMLSDDLGDIYRDLKRFLLLLDSGQYESVENACWEIRFSFNSHWAEHCMSAMKVIHDSQYRDGGGW